MPSLPRSAYPVKDGLVHRARRVGIDTGQEAVVYLHRDSQLGRSEGFETETRVWVRVGSRAILATLNVPCGAGVLRFGALATYRGSLGGWLQAYRDPDLSCWMDTCFEGRLVRDTLQGTFVSRRMDTDTVRLGTWWATRTK